VESDRRNVVVAIRLTQTEHARWLRVAKREDLKLIELIRESVRSHLRALEPLRLVGPERGERVVLSAVRDGSG
jgi:hypothetical protein